MDDLDPILAVPPSWQSTEDHLTLYSPHAGVVSSASQTLDARLPVGVAEDVVRHFVDPKEEDIFSCLSGSSWRSTYYFEIQGTFGDVHPDVDGVASIELRLHCSAPDADMMSRGRVLLRPFYKEGSFDCLLGLSYSELCGPPREWARFNVTMVGRKARVEVSFVDFDMVLSFLPHRANSAAVDQWWRPAS